MRALQTLLPCGVDPMTPFVGRSIPLLDRAAAAENAPAVRALLTFLGSGPSARGRLTPYEPALISAVHKSFLDVVEVLCGDERVDVNIVGVARVVSVLHIAVQIGSQEIVQWGFGYRETVARGGWRRCQPERRLDTVPKLQQAPRARAPPSPIHTPLLFAAIGEHLSVVHLLAEREGVNVNAQDIRGGTPLDHAVRRRHRKIVQVLKDHGAIDKGHEKRRHAITPGGLGCFREMRRGVPMYPVSLLS
ncbi:ankyrin repeat-containing domain protein [Tuber brumale]|nr:ankyrin repeat-containing domain protein [Tuber brumale]